MMDLGSIQIPGLRGQFDLWGELFLEEIIPETRADENRTEMKRQRPTCFWTVCLCQRSDYNVTGHNPTRLVFADRHRSALCYEDRSCVTRNHSVNACLEVFP